MGSESNVARDIRNDYALGEGEKSLRREHIEILSRQKNSDSIH